MMLAADKEVVGIEDVVIEMEVVVEVSNVVKYGASCHVAWVATVTQRARYVH